MHSRAGVVVCLSIDQCRAAARLLQFLALQYRRRPFYEQHWPAFSSYPAVIVSLRLHPNKLVAPYSPALPAASFKSPYRKCFGPNFLPLPATFAEALPIKANDF
jgi:hypothetical protein